MIESSILIRCCRFNQFQCMKRSRSTASFSNISCSVNGALSLSSNHGIWDNFINPTCYLFSARSYSYDSPSPWLTTQYFVTNSSRISSTSKPPKSETEICFYFSKANPSVLRCLSLPSLRSYHTYQPVFARSRPGVKARVSSERLMEDKCKYNADKAEWHVASSNDGNDGNDGNDLVVDKDEFGGFDGFDESEVCLVYSDDEYETEPNSAAASYALASDKNSRHLDYTDDLDEARSVVRDNHNDHDLQNLQNISPPVSGIRLSRLIAEHSGTRISRREAERLIRAGSAKIAGIVVTSPQRIVTEQEYQNGAVTLHGKAIQVVPVSPNMSSSTHRSNSRSSNGNQMEHLSPAIPRVWIAHKLAGELVTENDPSNRPSLLARLRQAGIHKRHGQNFTGHHQQQPRQNQKMYIKAIGRLDMNTEGLILLTNCGTYAREMEIPSNQIHRTYRVRVHGALTPQKIVSIERGTVRATIDTNIHHKSSNNRTTSTDNQTNTQTSRPLIRYGPMKITVDEAGRKLKKNNNNIRRKTNSNPIQYDGPMRSSTNTWVTVTCSEGKNRQIRNVFKSLGLTVTRLIRISYGDYHIQTIPPGMAIEVPYKPIEHQRLKGPLVISARSKNKNTTQRGRVGKKIGSSSSSKGEETKIIPVQWIRNI